MPFFARPNLDNEQFKQLTGTTLTLSGQTQIATVDGLTLATGNTGGGVVITAEGAGIGVTDYHVLTFDPTDSKIKLMDMGTGSTGFYTGNSPATIDLGGISGGTTLTGKTISDILSELLTPTVNPTVSNPFMTLTIAPTTTTFEVGCSLPLTGITNFNQGSVVPVYDSGGVCIAACGARSGLPSAYCYTGNILSGSFSSTALSDCRTLTHPVVFGTNQWSSRVFYSAGQTVYDSSGSVYCTALPAYCTSVNTKNINGIYPYYWGKVDCGDIPAGSNRPAPTAGLIIGGCKVQQPSTGTITINFNSNACEYIWFAIPNNGGADKNCWYISEINKGLIGGAVSPGGNLFPVFDTVVNVNSAQGCWSGQTYKLYISNYQTAVSQPMQLRNS